MYAKGCRVHAAVTAGMVTALGGLEGLTFWGQWSVPGAGRLRPLDLVVGLVALALVPVLSRWPVAAGLALGALAALSPVVTPPATAAALVTGRWRRFPAALAVGLVGLAGHAVQALWRRPGGLSYPWWLVLMAATYAALIGWGALAQARAALLDSLRERARRAEAEQGRRVAEARVLERARMAREMHDVLAHRLTLVATYAGALEYRPDAPAEQVSRAAGVVRAGVHQALDELRDVILLLRADDGGAGGEAAGRPQPGLTDLPRLVEESRAAGLSVELRDTVPTPEAVPGPAGRTAYRVVQEGLTNARKHAAGQPVSVAVAGTPGGRLTIDIRNPLPATVGPPPPGTGTGLVGLTERVALAGGHLDHEVTGTGFRLRAWLPWPG